MQEEKETGRIEAFSDGVFAVAITLLVLDLKVPALQPGNLHFSLARELLAQYPAYVAFITSFVTILVMWINHHRVFSLIKRADDKFMLLNGLLLLCVTVIPFATSLAAAYIRQPGARLAVLVYSGINFCMAVCFKSLWEHASKNGRLLAHDHDKDVALGLTRSYRFGPLVYLVVFGVAFVSVGASVAMVVLLAIFFTIPPRKHAEHSRQR